MQGKPLENLKGFTATRPPFVIFTICILLFAIALISLGSYIKRNEVPDYDIDYDWNTLLQGFSKMEFCLLPNDTHTDSPTTTTTASSVLNSTSTPAASTTAEVLEEIDGLYMKNASIAISVSLRAHASSHSQIHYGATHLFSKFTAAELGIQDGSEKMYISFELSEPLKALDCADSGCTSQSLSACLTIIGPQYIFPRTRHPELCNVTEMTKQDKVTKMRPKSTQDSDPVQWCKKGTVAKANHQFDPQLTVMLSSIQRSIINMHLMYTSYFLFVMLITCVCYALVKGPPLKHRTITNTTVNEKRILAPI